MRTDRPRLPYFIPATLDFKQLPGGFQEGVDIILSVYQELVLEAPTSLEQSAGITVCFSMWLELLEQFQLGRTLRKTLPKRSAVGVITNPTERYGGPFLPPDLSLERYLRLGAQKEKVLKFLLQFRVARVRGWRAARAAVACS
jgi:hypothetical protein